MKIAEHITIPIPRATTNVNRGYKLDPDDKLYPVSFRMLNSEERLIDKACLQLGITKSEFIRWVTFYAAKQTLHEIELAEYQ